MPRFVIERQMPGAGSLTADQLKAAAQTSCGVLNALGPTIQTIWFGTPSRSSRWGSVLR